MARYLKQDSELGYIEDTAEIQYQKFNNLRHSIIGFMMGDFDQEGNYVISPEIKRELIAMQKYIVDSLDNIEICQSEIKLNKHLSFMVTFEGERATLSLLEKMNYEANFKLNSGSYSNINEYLLDEVITSGTVNRNVIYQRWNIKEFGGNQVDIFNCDDAVLEKYFGIVNRFKYLLLANKKLLEKEEEIEEIEASYANKMLDILKAYPELNKAVMAQIKETLEEKKKFICADEPNFAKTFNEILDKAIETNLDSLAPENKEAFNAERRNLIVETNLKKQEVLEIAEKEQSLEKDDLKYNKSHNNENENNSKVVVLNTNGVELKESVQDLAAEFARENKKVETRITEQVVVQAIETEKKKLVEKVGEENLTDKAKEILKPTTKPETEKEKLIATIKSTYNKAEVVTDATKEKIEERKEELSKKVETTKKEPDLKPEVKEEKKVESKPRTPVSWATKMKGTEFKYTAPKEESGKTPAKGKSEESKDKQKPSTSLLYYAGRGRTKTEGAETNTETKEEVPSEIHKEGTVSEESSSLKSKLKGTITKLTTSKTIKLEQTIADDSLDLSKKSTMKDVSVGSALDPFTKGPGIDLS